LLPVSSGEIANSRRGEPTFW
jgi:hypothetical protein